MSNLSVKIHVVQEWNKFNTIVWVNSLDDCRLFQLSLKEIPELCKQLMSIAEQHNCFTPVVEREFPYTTKWLKAQRTLLLNTEQYEAAQNITDVINTMQRAEREKRAALAEKQALKEKQVTNDKLQPCKQNKLQSARL